VPAGVSETLSPIRFVSNICRIAAISGDLSRNIEHLLCSLQTFPTATTLNIPIPFRMVRMVWILMPHRSPLRAAYLFSVPVLGKAGAVSRNGILKRAAEGVARIYYAPTPALRKLIPGLTALYVVRRCGGYGRHTRVSIGRAILLCGAALSPSGGSSVT
jgi:hypothetical protein